VLGRFGHAGFLRGHRASKLLLRAAVSLRPGVGLSGAGAQALTAAVEALVPSRPASPNGEAAIDLRAVVLRAQQHLYTLRPRDRRDLCAYLDLLEHVLPPLTRTGLRFSRLPLDARRRCLAACERSSIALFATGHAALRHLALVAFMEAPEVWPDPQTLT
jgi:hypothetical protein